MTFEEAKALLSLCERNELRDHAFGDAEVYWDQGDKNIAEGYFGREIEEVRVAGTNFTGKEARELRRVGKTGKIERNDAGGSTTWE